MATIRLAYVSLAPDLTPDVLDSILTTSDRTNQWLGIGGFLLLLGGCVFQVLEGDEARVRELFDHIRRDPRHHDVQVVCDRRVAKRTFVQWGMMNLSARPRLFRALWPRPRDGDDSLSLAEACARDPAFVDRLIDAGALIHDLSSPVGHELGTLRKARPTRDSAPAPRASFPQASDRSAPGGTQDG